MEILPEIGLTQESKEFINGLLPLIDSSLCHCEEEKEMFVDALVPIIEATQMVREADSGIETDVDVDFNLINARKEYKENLKKLQNNLDLTGWLLEIIKILSLMVLGRSREYEDRVSEFLERAITVRNDLKSLAISGQEDIVSMNYEIMISNSKDNKTWNPTI